MLTLIDKLIVREVLKTLLVILVVLLLLVLANSLVRLLQDVAAGEISLRLMAIFFGVQVIRLVSFLAPPAFFFAILWVVGQMYRNSEMAALNAAGVSLLRLYLPFTLVAMLLALFVGAFSLQIYPMAQAYAEAIAQREQSSVQFGGLRPGGFSEFGKGRYMVYVGRQLGDQRLGDLFIRYENQGDKSLVLARASRVEQREEGRFLVLEEGYRYDGEPGTDDFASGRFRRYAIRLPEARGAYRASGVEMLPLPVLLASDALKLRTELQWRLATPLSVFALMLVSLPLARSLPREGVYGRLVMAVIFYAVYLNLLRLAEDWMKRGDTPDWLGIWWVPAAAALLGVGLLLFDHLALSARLRRMLARRS